MAVTLMWRLMKSPTPADARPDSSRRHGVMMACHPSRAAHPCARRSSSPSTRSSCAATAFTEGSHFSKNSRHVPHDEPL
eukprot:346285-Pyramimonas_sp.AAC.1